ncbi:hypothetical protein CHUAL_004636 [Chamberlinius hualienensis]
MATAASGFDPNDRESWYFGSMSRQDATDLLMSEREGGVFLVRDSSTIHGDFVLCVREDNKVSHYIINKVQQNDATKFRIGDQLFPDLPSLLSFYKIHYLDTTPLMRPAPKRVEKVVAKYDFAGNDQEDLPFKKGEVLTIISKDEEQWWTARNSLGRSGSIPVPYVVKYEEQWATNDSSLRSSFPQSQSMISQQPIQERNRVNAEKPNTASTISITRQSTGQRKLPAFAKVKQARVPNAYDKTALKLEVGDVVKVTKMNINGQWEGELNGKVGHFPFTHVEFPDTEDLTDETS